MTDYQPFTNSDHLLGDEQALREQLDRDGYLYLSGVADPDTLLRLREDILAIFEAQNWLKPGSPRAEARTGRVPTIEGEEDYFAVYDQVQKLESLHSLPHHRDIMSVMRQAVGESAFPHPLGVARLSFPNNEECTTPPHQDYPNNQGTEALYACWIPLSDCPISLGGISVLQGSHKLGLMPLDYSLGAGGRQARLSEEARSLSWVAGEFKLGDVLIFGSLTIHSALPNLSGDRFRISVDYRFQEEGQPLTERVLKPHFERLSWEEIYAGWQSKELQYYWKRKQFPVVDWNDSMHELPPEHMREALRLSRAYNQRRSAMRREQSS